MRHTLGGLALCIGVGFVSEPCSPCALQPIPMGTTSVKQKGPLLRRLHQLPSYVCCGPCTWQSQHSLALKQTAQWSTKLQRRLARLSCSVGTTRLRLGPGHNSGPHQMPTSCSPISNRAKSSKQAWTFSSPPLVRSWFHLPSAQPACVYYNSAD